MKYVNFSLFTLSFLLLFLLQSHRQLSTSLLSILPKGESKKLIESFEKSENSKVLLVAVKGFQPEALEKIKAVEKALIALPALSFKRLEVNSKLQTHQEAYKLFMHEIDEVKFSKLDASKALNGLYKEMTSSFFPVKIDKVDPFELLLVGENPKVKLKNNHLVLGDYGYLSIFNIKSNGLDEHRQVYEQIHTLLGEEKALKLFSPLFYYVENSQAIMSDMNKIVFMALGILLLLYLFILKDVSLLLNTLMTLGTSGVVAIIILTQIYGEISIFVFVFGISISTVAVDYMFHHYVHGYYDGKKTYNHEVLFGLLTTLSAFFILSFSAFLLIKQITVFAILSLLISYLHFAFLYPNIGFRTFELKKSKFTMPFTFSNVKGVFFFSLVVIALSPLWISFDFNLKNLDYDNKTLKESEAFFSKHLDSQENITFAVKANSIDALITNAQEIRHNIPSVNLPLALLLSEKSYRESKRKLEAMHSVKTKLQSEAKRLGFKKDYFKDAYSVHRPFVKYTYEDIQAYGIEIVKINDSYFSYGRVSKAFYEKVLAYKSVKKLSLKEHFEASMKASVDKLFQLGVLALLVIGLLLYLFTQKAILYAMVFLVFPVALLTLYAFFTAINILHIFMLFVILAIGIDYAIYVSKTNNALTKRAILYSLISTFAGFGVLVFSAINALFSIGVIATIGLFAIFILLLIKDDDVS